MKISELPVSWYGLSQAEVMAVLPFVWGMSKSAKARINTVKALIDKKEFKALTEDDIYDLTENELAFLWSEDIQGKPFAHFVCNNKTFILPEAGMGSVSLQEFLNCNTCFLEFSDTAKNDPTNEAVLIESATALVFNACRPSNKVPATSALWNGDCREPYNEHVADARAKTNKIDFALAVLITRYWGQELKDFYDRYDILDDHAPTDPNDPDPEPEPTWIDLAMAWKNTHFDLAQDRALGDFNAISKMNMPDIGLYLAKLKQQAKAREQAERMANIHNENNN